MLFCPNISLETSDIFCEVVLIFFSYRFLYITGALKVKNPSVDFEFQTPEGMKTEEQRKKAIVTNNLGKKKLSVGLTSQEVFVKKFGLA